MLERLRNLVWDEEGQGMVEYGLIIAIISIALVAIMATLKVGIHDTFKSASDVLKSPGSVTTE